MGPAGPFLSQPGSPSSPRLAISTRCFQRYLSCATISGTGSLALGGRVSFMYSTHWGSTKGFGIINSLMILTLSLTQVWEPKDLFSSLDFYSRSRHPASVSRRRKGNQRMLRIYKIISVCCQQLPQGQEKKLNAFMQRKCSRMQKTDISKQNLFPSAPINGKCSKTSKGSCFLKVLRGKKKVKMAQQWWGNVRLKTETISPSSFLLNY